MRPLWLPGTLADGIERGGWKAYSGSGHTNHAARRYEHAHGEGERREV